MPLLAINLSDKIFIQVKELVEKGAYQSPESFLEIAAFNQLALERGASPAEVIARGHRKTVEATSGNGSAHPPGRTAEKSSGQGSMRRQAAAAPAQLVVVAEMDAAPTMMRLTWRERSERCAKPVAPLETHTEGEHVFGQVNRLFGLKVACRWIATASAETEQWPEYKVVCDQLAEDAGVIGSLLERWDTAAGRKRDDVLSTGLPRSGNQPSKNRFLTQFLARVTRTGLFPTTIAQYQLAKFEDGRIALTTPGLEFASLSNPILDGDGAKATATLSDTEAAFLVRQITDWVPYECHEMQAVLGAIADGKVTPSTLADSVRKEFPEDWSDDMYKTQISGLIARLGDLRFVRRQYQGRFVTYELINKERIDAFLQCSKPKAVQP